MPTSKLDELRQKLRWPNTHPKVKQNVPLKWRIRWFLMGMATFVGWRWTHEQMMDEVFKCSDETENRDRA